MFSTDIERNLAPEEGLTNHKASSKALVDRPRKSVVLALEEDTLSKVGSAKVEPVVS